MSKKLKTFGKRWQTIDDTLNVFIRYIENEKFNIGS